MFNKEDYSELFNEISKNNIEASTKEQRQKDRKEKFRFWAPIAISSTLSIIAIIISILSLVVSLNG